MIWGLDKGMWIHCGFYVRSKLFRFSVGSPAVHLGITFGLDHRRSLGEPTLNCISSKVSVGAHAMLNVGSGPGGVIHTNLEFYTK